MAVTPATHCRVLDRPLPASTLESIFGWNRPFDRDALDPEIFDRMPRCLKESRAATSRRCASPPSTISSSRILERCASNFSYGEIDPDVFGEELDRQAYANADRIAAIRLTAEKRE